MSTIKKILETDTHVAPGADLTATEQIELFVDNETGHRDLVYGDRYVKGAAPAHDHGHHGGRVLQYPLVNVTFASVRANGDAAPGVFIGPPADGVDTTVETGFPKRLCVVPLYVPGGVSECKIKIVISTPADITGMDLRCKIGFYEHALLHYEVHPGIDVPLTNLGTNPIDVFSSDAIDLTELGDCTVEQELEIVIYQAVAAAASDNHLSGLICYATDYTRGRRVTQQDLPYRPVQPGDIVGAIVSPELCAAIRNQENTRAIALLGRAPGLSPQLTPDKRRPFVEHIYYPHQHQGVLCPDGYGGFVSDGRVIRKQYASVYCNSVGESINIDVDGDPGRGFLIHPNGALDGDWGAFYKRIPISCGTPFLDFRFALQPTTTDVFTRLRFQVSIYRAESLSQLSASYGGDDIALIADQSVFPIRYLSAGTQYRSSIIDDISHSIEVDPLNHPAFYRNEELKEQQGKWSLYTRKTASDSPKGTDFTHAYRHSQTITAHLSQPALREEDDPHPTMDWHIAIRLSLETLDSGGYDEGARLLWWTAIPRDME